jgi:hypothetical protein
VGGWVSFFFFGRGGAGYGVWSVEVWGNGGSSRYSLNLQFHISEKTWSTFWT